MRRSCPMGLLLLSLALVGLARAGALSSEECASLG